MQLCARLLVLVLGAESVRNLARHSRDNNAKVLLQEDTEPISAEVVDDFDFEDAVKRLEEAQHKFREVTNKVDHLEEEVEKERIRMQTMTEEEKINEVKENILKLETELELMRTQMRELNLLVDSLKDQADHIRRQEIAEEMHEVQMARERMFQLNTTLDALRLEQGKLRSLSTANKTRLSEVEEQIKDAQEEYKELHEEMVKDEKELRELQEFLYREEKQLMEMREKMAEYSDRLATLRAKLAACEDDAKRANLEKEITDLEAKMASLEDKMAAVDVPGTETTQALGNRGPGGVGNLNTILVIVACSLFGGILLIALVALVYRARS